MIELSNRLGQIARMVQPGSVVADIGTDHGQLMAYLAQNGIIRHGYACDINEKPLNKARQILADHGLDDRVGCGHRRLSGNGARILDAAPWIREHRTRLLLQPMTKPDHLREYLCREGFRLELENAVISGKFVYTVFSAVYDGVPRELSLLERYIGRVLDGDSADTDRYLMRIRRNLLGRIAGIDRSRSGDPVHRTEYETVVRMLEMFLEERGYHVDCLDDLWEAEFAGSLCNPGELG